MKNRILIALCIFTVLLFTGCGKKEIETEPVVSETVEESEPTEESVSETKTAEIEESAETVEPVEEETEAVESSETVDELEPEDIPSGTDTPTDEEVEAEIKDQQQQSSDNTNNGQGYELNGQHYDTLEEYQEAFVESLKQREGSDGVVIVEDEDGDGYVSLDEIYGH